MKNLCLLTNLTNIIEQLLFARFWGWLVELDTHGLCLQEFREVKRADLKQVNTALMSTARELQVPGGARTPECQDGAWSEKASLRQGY
jgi:hypothetical protein